MIERETLTAYHEDALDPAARARVEAQLADDPESLRFIVEQRKLDRLLRSTLRPVAAKQRVRQSILAAVRASAPEQIKARVIEATGVLACRKARRPARRNSNQERKRALALDESFGRRARPS